jgi:hypothetical protein
LARIALLFTRLNSPCALLLVPGRSPPLGSCSCAHTPTPPASAPYLLQCLFLPSSRTHPAPVPAHACFRVVRAHSEPQTHACTGPVLLLHLHAPRCAPPALASRPSRAAAPNAGLPPTNCRPRLLPRSIRSSAAWIPSARSLLPQRLCQRRHCSCACAEPPRAEPPGARSRSWACAQMARLRACRAPTPHAPSPACAAAWSRPSRALHPSPVPLVRPPL